MPNDESTSGEESPPLVQTSLQLPKNHGKNLQARRHNHLVAQTVRSPDQSPELSSPDSDIELSDGNVEEWDDNNVTKDIEDDREPEDEIQSLSWFQFHPQMNYFGKPLSVWSHDLFEPGSHIIPIQFVQSRLVSIIGEIHDETVLIVCPCIDF